MEMMRRASPRGVQTSTTQRPFRCPAVDEAVQRIRIDPLAFALLETLPDEPNVRRFLLNRFPYAIIYEVVSTEIRILAVAHARRRPQFWEKRRGGSN